MNPLPPNPFRGCILKPLFQREEVKKKLSTWARTRKPVKNKNAGKLFSLPA